MEIKGGVRNGWTKALGSGSDTRRKVDGVGVEAPNVVKRRKIVKFSG